MYASTRDTFDRQLKSLLDDVQNLGTMVEQAIAGAVESLQKRDRQQAEQVYAGDLLINVKRYEIENSCLILIATQQPMARDLRLLAAVLEIITELERIGDYAKGISKITMLVGDEPPTRHIGDFMEMSQIGLEMLRRSLAAFLTMDTDEAYAIADLDGQVDILYNKIYRGLLDLMIADPGLIDRYTHLIWAAHNLERLADRVTNICERIIFVARGEILELDHTDDEQLMD